jgi:general secretion pathway protein E
LDKSKGGAQLEELDLAPKTSEIIHRVIERPNGIILVSGPTGSGKTTTLYSILRKLNRPETNIITIEDPVEYTVQGINQVQVHEKIGLSFASALRSILRQDPDVLLIGEIRDGETARIATQSSLTGHLVLSTIHTNSAPSSVTRLIDMGVEPFLVSSTLACVISQRLVRRLCEHCKKAYKPPARLVERLGLSAAKAAKITFYQADGCDKCFNNGYRGRVALFEVMEVTDELAALIIDRADAGAIKQQALRDGMVQLIDDGVRLIMSGTTTVEEILSVAYADG